MRGCERRVHCSSMPLPPIFGPRDRHLEVAYRAATQTAAPPGLYDSFSHWLYATTQWRLNVVAITAIAINIPLLLIFDLSGSYGAGDFTPAEG
jgi:hypothetical protein